MRLRQQSNQNLFSSQLNETFRWLVLHPQVEAATPRARQAVLESRRRTALSRQLPHSAEGTQ
jgi:homoserine kinase